jgi:hypothetical protein
LITKYIAPNTDNRESAIVKIGNFVIGKYLSNFMPAHTPNAMVSPICKERDKNFP